jgi:uncharacterized protein (DUF1501 family)
MATAAFTFAAPAFLQRLAAVQGFTRNLVVLDLAGGNDSLSMLVPYTDPFYYSRRPTQAVPAANVLPIGSDSSGKPLGFHPRLTGLKQMYDDGRLALIQRTGYANSSRSHFLGQDIWSSARPTNPQTAGWVGRYLDTLLAPVDPLIGWATIGILPRTLLANTVSVPTIPNPATYTFNSPNGTGAEGIAERNATAQIASHLPVGQPVVSYVCGSAQAALATLDRVDLVDNYVPAVTYPTSSFAQALRAISGAIAKDIGTKVFWVQTGGYDTHANQNTNSPVNGSYYNLMATLNDGLIAFYNDLILQGTINETLVLEFSEFGRRISENGSGTGQGTDHGAATLMFAMGGPVRGGIYGTAPSLAPDGNPTLENNNGDIRYETDFRSVYAAVLDNWLRADSVAILGGDYRNPAMNFVAPTLML